MFSFSTSLLGNANCFLFKLSPEMGVYVPTGYNENYMYLQQNAQTLPNGLVSVIPHCDHKWQVFYKRQPHS